MQRAKRVAPLRVPGSGFESLGGREFCIDIDWQADGPVPDGWMPFLHFVDAEGKIVFQGFELVQDDFTSGQLVWKHREL